MNEKPKRMSALIVFNVTEAERDRIRMKAGARGWTVAQFMREILRTSPVMKTTITERMNDDARA